MQLRTDVDLNLITALDRLIDTQSVTIAARQLHLSVPAMSHSLGRIRRTFDDPILVRSGRGMALTPRAEQLRQPAQEIVERIQALLLPPGPFDPAAITRSFAIRASDALVGVLGQRLAETLSSEAPQATIVFLTEGGDDDVEALRKNGIDLSITAALDPAPDITQLRLFDDGFVSIVRAGHPLMTGSVTAERFAAASHAVTSRHGRPRGPIDEGLRAIDLTRHVALITPTYYAAVFAAAASNLVACVPERLARELAPMTGLATFTIPLELPQYTVVAAWHRRWNEDPGHRWLRTRIAETISDQT